MTAVELAKRLEVDVEQIDAWVSEGIPCSGEGAKRRFEPAEVREWLLARGAAKPQNVVPTLEEVAKHFDVSRRQVSKWRNQMDMPGTDGAFDLDEIAAWREARMGTSTEKDDTEDRGFWETRKAKAAAELAELKLNEKAGRLIDVAGPTRVLVQTVNAIRTHIEQLPDRLAELAQLDPEGQGEVRRAARALVGDMLYSIERQLNTAADELLDNGDSEGGK